MCDAQATSTSCASPLRGGAEQGRGAGCARRAGQGCMLHLSSTCSRRIHTKPASQHPSEPHQCQFWDEAVPPDNMPSSRAILPPPSCGHGPLPHQHSAYARNRPTACPLLLHPKECDTGTAKYGTVQPEDHGFAPTPHTHTCAPRARLGRHAVIAGILLLAGPAARQAAAACMLQALRHARPSSASPLAPVHLLPNPNRPPSGGLRAHTLSLATMPCWSAKGPKDSGQERKQAPSSRCRGGHAVHAAAPGAPNQQRHRAADRACAPPPAALPCAPPPCLRR